MLFDVLAEYAERRPTTTEYAIRPTPEYRLSIPMSKFRPIGFTQQSRGDGLHIVDEGGQEHRWRHFDQEVHVIVFAIAFDERATPFFQQRCKCPHQVFTHHRRQAFPTVLGDENQMEV